MRWFHTLLLAYLLHSSRAEEEKLEHQFENHPRCEGMYSRKTWGGSEDPFILIKFDSSPPKEPQSNDDPIVSLIIFEWKDKSLVGKSTPDGQVIRSPIISRKPLLTIATAAQIEYFCDSQTVQQNYCNQTDIGKFILKDNATELSGNPIITEVVHLNNPSPIKYQIKHTGYYCVGTGSDSEYNAVVDFRNSYGELPAAQIAKLPFFGGLAIIYAVIGAFWLFLYVQHRHDILAVQNYISAIIIFLIVEMVMTWGFYDYLNRHGSNVVAKVLMVIVAVLNAGRNSFSFFLLLIVCMGYGVVKPTLGKAMMVVRGLAATHFVFGVIYSVASLSITPDSVGEIPGLELCLHSALKNLMSLGPLVLLIVLPLAATLSIFYVWTLNSLAATLKDLVDRKQSVKALMYRKLWWSILVSVLVIFGFFFINSITFVGRSDPDFVPNHWKTRWFILDGWLNVVYLFEISFVAYLWRPTANNRRFAMSDEIAQEDEGFEIASFGGSLDEEEGGEGDGVQTPDASRDPPSNSNGSTRASKAPATRDHRESLDGEPIFAVGDDGDRWSDADSPRNSGELKRLTGKDN
ncbi:MAG: hypothetical protein M1829_004288 [Trizodia sp. TS-e1964]|nr:MAG: hypothetical protein M1829_004288 [Trizodia sp. TS-e1964]